MSNMATNPSTSTSEQQNGWTAVPVDPQKILLGKPYVHAPEPVTVASVGWPQSAVVDKVQQYAKARLPEKVYNHSMRVYYYCECAESSPGGGVRAVSRKPCRTQVLWLLCVTCGWPSLRVCEASLTHQRTRS